MMDFPALLGFSIFAAVAAFTPGPNNLMLAASGANFGLRRTLPHILGITTGFLSLVVFGSFGLGALFTAWPEILVIARWASGIFLLYLCYRIATAAPPEGGNTYARPIGFVTAMLFQIVNPKALVVITSAVTAYAGTADNLYLATFLVTVIFAFVTVTSTLLWAYAGSLFGTWLNDRRKLRLFNFTMSGLLLIGLTPVIFTL